ncbi:MAG TPA: hypothetical protein VF277_08065 [Steroidobacteraceae bacterium]
MNKPKSRRLRSPYTAHDGYGDPAIEALIQLIETERTLARGEEPALVDRIDSGQVWLLWFAIGATDEICHFVHRRAEFERNQVFRHVVGLIFGGGVRSPSSPVDASQRLIDLFESAGNEAVRACMRGDRRLGYYLEALKVSQQTLS